MRCHVYKIPRKAGTYVYLRDRDAFDLLPAQLRDVLGRLEFVLDFELTASSKLAQELPQNVMASLLECGYHLQFPPVDVVSGPAIPPAL